MKQRIPAELNREAAIDRFLKITAIPGPSGQEREVADAIVELLLGGGLEPSSVLWDGAETRTRTAGNCGNLIVHLPGRGNGPRTMLSAHMDTVPVCVGSDPVIEGGRIRSRADTGLGADNRSGCAAILTAAVERMAQGDEGLPPAVLVFFIQEEIGLEGSRHLDVSKIGPVDRAFNFDGGTVEKLTHGAVGGERIDIRVNGVPAHAGVAPEEGASAIVMASRAIAELYDHGWLGKVERAEGVGTSNVGVIQGGDATNVVTPVVRLRAEARSHNAAMRTRIVDEIRGAFQRAAAGVSSQAGTTGTVEVESHVDYEAFALAPEHPSIVAGAAAVRCIGREPFTQLANGGLDANWLYRHGIEAVTLGCGQRSIHTADEYLEIDDYLDACRIATALITHATDDEERAGHDEG